MGMMEPVVMVVTEPVVMVVTEPVVMVEPVAVTVVMVVTEPVVMVEPMATVPSRPTVAVVVVAAGAVASYSCLPRPETLHPHM